MSPPRVLALSIAVLLAGQPGLAQTSPIGRGTWLIGGSGSFHSAKDIGNNNTSFVIDLSPRIGYFVRPHLALNANLRFGRVTYDLGHGYDWGIGPGLTYYLGAPQHRVFPYLTARTLFLWSSSHSNDPASSPYRTWNESWLVGAGTTAMVAKNVGLTGELFYQHDHFGDELNQRQEANNSEEYGFNIGVTVFLF